jgi:hypothetical protein
VSRPRLFDRPECKNCVFNVEATVGTNAHTTFGGLMRWRGGSFPELKSSSTQKIKNIKLWL